MYDFFYFLFNKVSVYSNTNNTYLATGKKKLKKKRKKDKLDVNYSYVAPNFTVKESKILTLEDSITHGKKNDRGFFEYTMLTLCL